MFKKINVLSMVLSIILAFMSTTAIAASAFSDLEENSAEDVVARWYDAGLISGYPDGTFKPDEAVTRAQFAKIISDLFVLDDTDAEFADVSKDAWYCPYVEKASKYMSFDETDNTPNGDILFLPEQAMNMTDAISTLSALTKVPDSVKEAESGELSRIELILMIDDILGGKNGFDYMVSVIDAHQAEESEINPLVALTKDSDMATWNDKGQVLLLSWHSYPQSYIPGEQFTCKYGEMWTFTDKEVLSWYDENANGVEDWELRFEQLLGLPATDNKTHVSAFWVDPDEIIRPAFQPDSTKQVTVQELDGSALGEHKEWFDGNAEYSYVTSAYPWTRLGYTYDWYVDDNEYGLTEFIILPDSVIDVEWTKSFDEFVVWLQEN